VTGASINGTARILGHIRAGGILIVGDHASNHVPPDIDLGIDQDMLSHHVGYDIGVSDVASALVGAGAVNAAYLATASRLVLDLNRDVYAPDLVPLSSDGRHIPGNVLDPSERAVRVARFHDAYHSGLEHIISTARPDMILSLHSFTPSLSTEPGMARPWQIGVLYNDDDRMARVAIPALEAEGLLVGDQLPYSGKDLNYTMNRHAEGNCIPYLGIEMRQDLVCSPVGVDKMARWLNLALDACRNTLAQDRELAT
jgi:predicted N-formylglutamate amidohydrolase